MMSQYGYDVTLEAADAQTNGHACEDLGNYNFADKCQSPGVDELDSSCVYCLAATPDSCTEGPVNREW